MPASWSEIKAGVDPEEAVHLITRLRLLLTQLHDMPSDIHQANALAVQGFAMPGLTAHETELVIRALRKAASPGRSGGIA